MPLSNDAKKYLRALLEYAEGFDGFQEVLMETFAAPDAEKDEAKFDAYCERLGELSSEIHTFLQTEQK